MVAESENCWLTGTMSPCPRLTTERLVLRSFEEDDLRPLFGAMTSDPVRSSLHVPDDYSLFSAWGSMLQWTGMWELKGFGQWALEERSSGRFVGRAGFHWRPDDDWPGEIGRAHV